MIFGNFLADETDTRVWELWRLLLDEVNVFCVWEGDETLILKSDSTEMAEGIHESHDWSLQRPSVWLNNLAFDLLEALARGCQPHT